MGVEAFDITTDSMCKAFRPKGQKKNSKWRPNCALTSTAAMHPFMKPFDYFECLKATQEISAWRVGCQRKHQTCHKVSRHSCSVSELGWIPDVFWPFPQIG